MTVLEDSQRTEIPSVSEPSRAGTLNREGDLRAAAAMVAVAAVVVVAAVAVAAAIVEMVVAALAAEAHSPLQT